MLPCGAIDWVCLSVMGWTPALWMEPVCRCGPAGSVGALPQEPLLRALASRHTPSRASGRVRHHGRERASYDACNSLNKESAMDELKAPRPLAVVTGASSGIGYHL